jgi:DNA-binding CsgD family transcriptional regulator
VTPEDSRIAVASLNVREYECLVFLSKGLTNAEIGAQIGIAHSTVNDYLKTMFKKLDVDRRVEAAVIAAKAGLA